MIDKDTFGLTLPKAILYNYMEVQVNLVSKYIY